MGVPVPSMVPGTLTMNGRAGRMALRGVCVAGWEGCLEVALTKHFTKQSSQDKGVWALR